MYWHTIQSWRGSRRGQLLLGAWAAIFLGLSLKSALSRRKVTRDDPESSKNDHKPPSTTRSKLKRVLRMAYRARGEAAPAAYTIVLSGAIVARMVASLKLYRQIGVLATKLASRDWSGLSDAQLQFALIAVPAAATAAFATFSETRLAIAFRDNLTQWLTGQYVDSDSAASATATVVVPDVDSRLTVDVDVVSRELSSLLAGLIKPAVEVIGLTASLCGMMGAGNVLKCYGAFFVLASWARAVVPSFKLFAQDISGAEAAYRAAATNTAEYSQEIEALGGRREEAVALKRLFERVLRLNKLQSIATIGADVLDTYVVRHLGTLAAFTAMLPALYSGSTDSESTEYAVTCLHLLVNVGLACRDAVVALRKVTVCGGLSERLIELHEAYEATASNATRTGDGLSFILDNVAIMVPCQPSKPLIRNMNLTISAGQNVLVSGPNGSGKSTFLRTLAGLLPVEGGCLTLPSGAGRVMLLTQRGYIAPWATLRQQITYGMTQASSVAEDRIVAAIDFAGLGDLVVRCGGIDAPVDIDTWAGLSGGQKQRVCIARLVLRQPAFALLDEATSAVPEDFEVRVYQRLLADCVTVISVSQRPQSVARFHQRLLDIRENGSYSLTDIQV